MKHRHTPFGYQIVDGEIAVHSIEAETVRQIYNLNVSGLGYASIAKTLNSGQVNYHPGMPWNKNMVARILANPRYIGLQGYPAIIDAGVFGAVMARRANNPYCHQQRRKQPELCRDYRLAAYQPSSKARRLTNDINRALERTPDPDMVRPMIFACAADKYNGIRGLHE